MQMMLLLLVQEQLVLPLLLTLGYQLKQMLQPLRMLLQKRYFAFYYHMLNVVVPWDRIFFERDASTISVVNVSVQSIRVS